MLKYLLLPILLLIKPADALACECTQVTFEELIERADLLFAGTLDSVELVEVEGAGNRTIFFQKLTFSVEKNYLQPDDHSTVVLFESYRTSCTYDFTESAGSEFIVFGLKSRNQESPLAIHAPGGEVNFAGQCSGTFMLNPPGRNPFTNSASEKLHLIEAYFNADIDVSAATPEQLYNEIWKDGVFDGFYAHENSMHPEGFRAEESYFKLWLQPCNVAELQEKEWSDIIVTFTVTRDGRLKDFIPMDIFDTDCNEEAVRVAKKMPDWIPATVHGIPISARSGVRVDFSDLFE